MNYAEQTNSSQFQGQNFQGSVPPQLNNRYPPNYQPTQNTFVGQPVQQQSPVQHQGGMVHQNSQQTMLPPQQQYGYQGGAQTYQGGFPNQGYSNQGVHPQQHPQQQGYPNQGGH